SSRAVWPEVGKPRAWMRLLAGQARSGSSAARISRRRSRMCSDPGGGSFEAKLNAADLVVGKSESACDVGPGNSDLQQVDDVGAGFLEGDFSPKDADRDAAWELYVELLTRVTTQDLPPEHGDEKAALESVYAVFPLTRQILRERGSGCGEFAKLAIPVLNQIIR